MKWLALLLVAGLFLAGCSEQKSSNASQTQIQQQNNNSSQTQIQQQTGRPIFEMYRTAKCVLIGYYITGCTAQCTGTIRNTGNLNGTASVTVSITTTDGKETLKGTTNPIYLPSAPVSQEQYTNNTKDWEVDINISCGSEFRPPETQIIDVS